MLVGVVDHTKNIELSYKILHVYTYVLHRLDFKKNKLNMQSHTVKRKGNFREKRTKTEFK